MNARLRHRVLLLGCAGAAALLPPVARAQSTGKEAEAELIAGIYGETLGAAAECPAIPRPRIDAAAALAAKHVKALAGRAAATAGAELETGMVRGRHDVDDGALTCVQAESELANLERDLSP